MRSCIVPFCKKTHDGVVVSCFRQASRAASKAGKGLAAQFAAAEDAMKMIAAQQAKPHVGHGVFAAGVFGVECQALPSVGMQLRARICRGMMQFRLLTTLMAAFAFLAFCSGFYCCAASELSELDCLQSAGWLP